MNEFNSLDTLVSTALTRNWCVNPACTTCGSFEFCNAIKTFPRDKIIEDLRKLNNEFFIMNNDVFRLIIREFSQLPLGGDLLVALDGTPAGEQLQKNIDYANNAFERWQRNEKLRATFESKEAVEARKIERKKLREIATAPHRERKDLNKEKITKIISIFHSTAPKDLLKIAKNLNTQIPMRTIGGLIYKILLDHYKKSPVPLQDQKIINELSDIYSGHWKKLAQNSFNIPRLKMSKKYPLPHFLFDVIPQAKYTRWLSAKAKAHVKRDQQLQPDITEIEYKKRIHEAVILSEGKDAYTGEPLDWSLLSTWDNDKAKEQGSRYKSQFALLPSVDHVSDRRGPTEFTICAWRTNAAKNDLSIEDFIQLCEKVIKHMR